MKGNLILTDKQSNSKQEKIIALLRTIDTGWKRVEQNLDAIRQEIKNSRKDS